MIDPKAIEAARRIEATRYVGSQFASDARTVARALLAGEGNNATAAAVPRPSSAEAGLREALKPFAEFADRFGDFARDDDWVLTRNPSNKGNLTMGDVRRARAAYAGKDATGEKAGLTQAARSDARPSSSPSPTVREVSADDLLSASPEDYWKQIVAEIRVAGKQCRHALLLNHQAAHLLAWATMARSAAQEESDHERG